MSNTPYFIVLTIIIVAALLIPAYPHLYRLFLNGCAYLLMLDLLRPHLNGFEFERLISYCSDDETKLASKWIFKRHKATVLRVLTDIDYSKWHHMRTNRRHFTSKKGHMLSANAYVVCCKHFISEHPDAYNTIETAVLTLSRKEHLPQLVYEFAVVNEDSVKKCRAFSVLSRMHARGHMRELANAIGGSDADKYLRY